MAGSRVGLFDNLNIPIHRDAQHREDDKEHAVSRQSIWLATSPLRLTSTGVPAGLTAVW